MWSLQCLKCHRHPHRAHWTWCQCGTRIALELLSSDNACALWSRVWSWTKSCMVYPAGRCRYVSAEPWHAWVRVTVSLGAVLISLGHANVAFLLLSSCSLHTGSGIEIRQLKHLVAGSSAKAAESLVGWIQSARAAVAERSQICFAEFRKDPRVQMTFNSKFSSLIRLQTPSHELVAVRRRLGSRLSQLRRSG